MAERTEVKVGDVGTVYFLPTYDNDLSEANFNPTAATTKQLLFKMPGASGLCLRDATAAQKTIGGVSVWGLQYTVLAADVAAYTSTTVGGFHQSAGAVKIEGYVEFSSAQKWASSTVTTDQQNRTLRVSSRLSA
jgi:hypothetical protein